ncbi:MAG: outer membrane beta-barrel protein [Verrucomicrobia bacterium]|nr:outer membrane beta-barrel protein [Verrucomicrobiota bacterium]
MNKWTLGLAAAGVVSLGSVVQADEKPSNNVLTKVSSTTISGYVSTSAAWGWGKTAPVGGYSFAKATDGFNLDVVSLTISKPLDEGEWSAGYTAQLWFGPDANALLNNSVAFGNFKDFNVRNAYVELRAPVGNGINFKLGVWDCPMGFESQNVGDNPNYSRSWGHTVEPTQMTGLLASYKVNDAFSLNAGVANTINSQINGRVASAQSQKAVVGGISLTAPDSLGFLKGAKLDAAVMDGRVAGAVTGPDTTVIYVGATIPTPLETLSVGLAWDHVNIAKSPASVGNGANPDADAVAIYLAFKASEKIKLNARVDYFDVGGAAVGLPAGTEVLSTTFTVDYALWENVISRLEYRWDHDMSGRVLGAGSFPGGRVNSSQIALNVIYKF